MREEGLHATRFRRRIVTALLVVYSAFVAVITLSPRMPGSGTVARLVNRVLRELHDRGLFTGVGYLHVEFVGNILMFVPLGVLVALLVSRRRWWVLLFLGTVLSGVIELGQLVFLHDRVSEARDLVSNSTGFLIGAAASVGLRLLTAHRDALVERDRLENASLEAGV